MKILGIDLGTTNSAVALVNQHGIPEIIQNREGDYVTPSVVFFDDAEAIVGRVAKHSATLDPSNLVQCVKREMGNKEWRFHPSSGGEFSPESISSLILRRLKEDAEMKCGEKFTHAVISVPAYFADPERQATQDAAEMAGLTPVRIINEPTAAALAYGLGSTASEERVVVYDLGGGTFDVSVLKITQDAVQVLGIGGDRRLGGVDWDNAIMKWLDDQFAADGGQRLLDAASPGSGAEEELREKAELAKHALSQMRQTKVVLSAGDRHKTVTLTRDVFEGFTSGLLKQTQFTLENVVQEAGLRWRDISKILLVGGSTKMPAVAEMVQRVSGLTPSREVHPDEAVALGAAVQAALYTGAGVTRMETGIKEVTVTDVTAHSLGVKLFDETTAESYNQILLDRGTTLPAKVEGWPLQTVNKNQTRWDVELTQGEDRELKYVKVIGSGQIDFKGAKPAGYPLRLDVEYDIDGIIHAFVFDGNTGAKFDELHITRVSNLSPGELAAMKQHVGRLALG